MIATTILIQGDNDCDNDFRTLLTYALASGIADVKASFKKSLKFAGAIIKNESKWSYSRI